MIDCKKCKVLKQIIDGQSKLLMCYRLGTQCGYEHITKTI